MEKIPVKIVELTSPSGKSAVDVMIDVFDYNEIENAQDKIRIFKKGYFDLVKKAKKILPKKKADRKTLHFWQIGKMLYDFNKSIENQFEITNYNSAIVRDFDLYQSSQVGHVIQFGEFFKKKEITDTIPMSTYLELIWKANLLKEKGIFEKEKIRLLERAKRKKLPGHKEYREELNALVSSKTKISKKVK